MASPGEEGKAAGRGGVAVDGALQDLRAGSAAPDPLDLFRTDLALRLLILAASLTSLGIIVSSHQTKVVSSPLLASPISLEAKFTHSSAVIYLVVATSAVCLHSILSTVAVVRRPKASPSSTRLLLLLAFLDAVMAAVMASASGGVASIAYIALKGNSHIGWNKVCYVFDKFCRHAASAVALCLMVSLALLLLVLTSTYSLYRRAAKSSGCFPQPQVDALPPASRM